MSPRDPDAPRDDDGGEPRDGGDARDGGDLRDDGEARDDGEPRDEELDAADEAELAALERTLAPLRPVAKVRARPRRRAGWVALAALAAALATTAMVPERAIPSQIAAVFHDDFPGEIGVRGGIRIEYQVFDATQTDAVAEALQRRGAAVVFARPGLIVVDAVGESAATARGWAEAVAGPRDLGIHRLADDHALIARFDHELALNGAARQLVVRRDTWIDVDGVEHRRNYLAGPDRATVEAELADLAAHDPALAVPAGVSVAFGPLDDVVAPIRVYFLEATPAITHGQVAATLLYYNPIAGQTMLGVELDRAGADALTATTRAALGDKLAIRIGDEVVMAPVVQGVLEGGWVEISSHQRGEGWARGLAGALRGPELPTVVTVGSLVEVAPVLTPTTALAARGVLGAIAGLVAGLMAWIVARTAPAAEPEVSPVRGRSRRAPWLVGLATLATLAGLVATGANATFAGSGLLHADVFRSFGYPLLAGLAAVELAVALVPRWRRARATRAGRRWAIASWLGLIALGAVLEARAMAEILEIITAAPGGEALGRGATIAAVALGPLAVLLGATLLGQITLLPPAALVVALIASGDLAAFAAAVDAGGFDASRIVVAVLAAAATILVTSWALRRRVGAARVLAVRLPAGGLVALAAPTLVLGGLLALVPLLPRAVADEVTMLAFGAHHGVVLLASVALAPIAAWWALRRRSVSVALVGDSDAARARRRHERIAIGLSTIFVAMLVGLGELAPVLGLALATAAGLDLVVTARARWRRDDLVAVGRIADAQRIDVAVEALAGRGIDVHIGGAALRAALGFGGTLWPAVIEVPAARRAEARELLATVFAAAPEAGGLIG